MSLGAALRSAGLGARGLAAWSGSDRPSVRMQALATQPTTIAAAPLQLFVAGGTIPRDRLRVPERIVDELVHAGLVDRRAEGDGDTLRPRVAILPIGPALVVCDRADAPATSDLVCWPDDSSYHLASSIPRGRRWLDLGCGSAFAALVRPELATTRVGIDLNPRAIELARLGALLSGVDLELAVGDVDAATGSYDLVTCNAPIVDDASPAVWRRTDAAFFARLWATARRLVAPGGTIVVHARRRELAPVGGEVAIATYGDGPSTFGVAWWRPDAPARAVEIARALTVAHPHLATTDRDAALSVTVPSS